MDNVQGGEQGGQGGLGAIVGLLSDKDKELLMKRVEESLRTEFAHALQSKIMDALGGLVGDLCDTLMHLDGEYTWHVPIR